MSPERFQELTTAFGRLCIAVAGDFSLDRYLEIDPARNETSLETGLPVHNIVRVRAQAGAAGTIVNNLAALGVGHIVPVGLAGDDGEGFELRRALAALPGVDLSHFTVTSERFTFTYCKPLLVEPRKPPVELSRLDTKNWSPTPAPLREQLVETLTRIAPRLDALILLDQVDVPETGVITPHLLAGVAAIAESRPKLLILADSRRGLKGYPPVCFKMNRRELVALTGLAPDSSPKAILDAARALARKQGRKVFVTLAEDGLVGAAPAGEAIHLPALPVRGDIDVVGAGDAVTANVTASLAAGATLDEALHIANAAASITVHKLGTTGTASPKELHKLLFPKVEARPPSA